MTDVAYLVVVGFAVFRLWVLLAQDNILSGPRSQLPDRVLGWLTCPWCSGFWLAVGVYFALREWGENFWVQSAVIVFALSGLVGALGVWTGKDVE